MQHGVDVDDDDWTPSPQSFHLPMCVAAGKPPSAGHITKVPTGQACGPEIRPNPLGPESHPVTHIVSFPYPAQEINYLNLITL